MNPAAKLAGFAGVLVLVFGLAVAAGSAIGPDREGEEAHGSEPDPVRGLSVADGGLKLALEPLRARASFASRSWTPRVGRCATTRSSTRSACT